MCFQSLDPSLGRMRKERGKDARKADSARSQSASLEGTQPSSERRPIASEAGEPRGLCCKQPARLRSPGQQRQAGHPHRQAGHPHRRLPIGLYKAGRAGLGLWVRVADSVLGVQRPSLDGRKFVTQQVYVMTALHSLTCGKRKGSVSASCCFSSSVGASSAY